MAVHPLRPATRRRLGRPLPHQQADRPRAHPTPHKAFHHDPYAMVVCGIRPSFPGLSHSAGQITHVLLTRSPLEYPPPRWWAFPFDLHVLSTPPAFVLSQDQTLQPQHTQTNACVVHKNKTKTIKIVFQACISLTRATHPHHRVGVCDTHTTTSSVWVCVVLGTLLSSHTTKNKHPPTPGAHACVLGFCFGDLI